MEPAVPERVGFLARTGGSKSLQNGKDMKEVLLEPPGRERTCPGPAECE
jgi:hypothetical protein